jgi:hypothetical protein
MGSLLQFGFRRGVILTEGFEVGHQSDGALRGDDALTVGGATVEIRVVGVPGGAAGGGIPEEGVDVNLAGAGAIVGEVRTDAAFAEEDRLLQDVVASHGGADAITAGDIAALPGWTDLLGVTTHATKGDVDRTPLDG